MSQEKSGSIFTQGFYKVSRRPSPHGCQNLPETVGDKLKRNHDFIPNREYYSRIGKIIPESGTEFAESATDSLIPYLLCGKHEYWNQDFGNRIPDREPNSRFGKLIPETGMFLEEDFEIPFKWQSYNGHSLK